MQRQIVFDGERAATRFTMVWQGFHFGSATIGRAGERGDMKTTRLDASIARKLKLVSEPEVKDGAPVMLPVGEPSRGLVDGAPSVFFSQPELDRLVACVEAVAWRAGVAEDAVDAVDFLNAADKIDEPTK